MYSQAINGNGDVDMRLGFVYEDRMRNVGYRTTMDLNSTFGEVLEDVCAMFNWNEDDYVFLFGNRFSKVNKQWTPAKMGMKDEDTMTIYCVLHTNPLLLSLQGDT
jgi:hypothetical protein